MRTFFGLIIFFVVILCFTPSESGAIRNSIVAEQDQTRLVASQNDEGEVTPDKELSLFSSTVKMIGSLAFVLAGILIIYWFMKKFVLKGGKAFGGGQLIQTLATSYLGEKKSISIVDVAGELLILGISAGNISLLTKIEDPDRAEQIKDAAGQRGGRSSFEDQFKRVSSRLRRNNRKDPVSELTDSVRDRVSKLKDI